MLYGLASYPKSGNTWCRAVLGNLLFPNGKPADINRLPANLLDLSRSLLDDYLDFATSDMLPDELENLRRDFYRNFGGGKSIFLKMHDAYAICPKGMPRYPAEAFGGVVFIVRNPLDIVVSLSHFFGITLEKAISNMETENWSIGGNREGGIALHLSQAVGSWSGHAASWLDQNSIPVHLMRFEDMLSDPMHAFGGMAKFLGLNSDRDTVAKAVTASRFEELQKQELENGCVLQGQGGGPFFRSGQAGQWRDILSSDQVRRVCARHASLMRRLDYDVPITGAP
jgi:aryl sulfotransferase